jgi:hypothetical protein
MIYINGKFPVLFSITLYMIIIILKSFFKLYLVGTYTEWIFCLSVFFIADLYYFVIYPLKSNRGHTPLNKIPFKQVKNDYIYKFIRKLYIYSILIRFVVILVFSYSIYPNDPLLTIYKEDRFHKNNDIVVFNNVFINFCRSYYNRECLLRIYIKRMFFFKQLVVSEKYCVDYDDIYGINIKYITVDSARIGDNTIDISVKNNNGFSVYGDHFHQFFAVKNIK